MTWSRKALIFERIGLFGSSSEQFSVVLRTINVNYITHNMGCWNVGLASLFLLIAITSYPSHKHFSRDVCVEIDESTNDVGGEEGCTNIALSA